MKIEDAFRSSVRERINRRLGPHRNTWWTIIFCMIAFGCLGLYVMHSLSPVEYAGSTTSRHRSSALSGPTNAPVAPARTSAVPSLARSGQVTPTIPARTSAAPSAARGGSVPPVATSAPVPRPTVIVTQIVYVIYVPLPVAAVMNGNAVVIPASGLSFSINGNNIVVGQNNLQYDTGWDRED